MGGELSLYQTSCIESLQGCCGREEVYRLLIRLLYSVHVELVPPKPPITYERKQLWSCGLHHWKERGKVASELEAQPIYSMGKCLFQIPIRSLWGYKKPQHYRLHHARILSHAFLPTAHVNHLLLTIGTKVCYFPTFFFWAVTELFGCSPVVKCLSGC